MEALRLIAVYFGACCLILWLSRRTLRPITAGACLALCSLPLVLTGPAMFTGSFWGGLNLAYSHTPLNSRAEELPLAPEEYDNAILSDHICEVLPWLAAVRDTAGNGHWPLRNRFLRAGDPLLGLAQPAPFHPKVWIGLLLPQATAFTFACSFTLFLAALFGFLYLAEIGLGEVASLFGAAVWMLSGFITFFCGWSLAAVFVALPLILLGVRRLARGVPGGFAAKTLGWTLALLAGHPESVLHLTAAAAVVFLWELFQVPRGRLRAIARVVGAGLVAAALAAPALLPFLEALPQTQDWALRRSGAAVPRQSLPADEALASAMAALYPNAYGRHWGPRDVLPGRFDDASGAFIGGLASAFGLLAAFSRRREKWLFAILGLLSFAVGVGLPGISHLVGGLPLFDLALNGRLTGVTAFCLSVLAALGFEAAVSSRRPRVWITMATAGIVFAACGAWRGSSMEIAGIDSAAHFRGLANLVLPVLIAAAAGLVVSSRRNGGHAQPSAVTNLALVWGALFLVSHVAELPRLYHRFPAELFYPPLEELARLPESQEPYRVTGHGFTMVPGQLALYGLEDVRGTDTMRHRRLAATYPWWCVQKSFWFCRVDDLTAPFLSFLNVRFAIAGPGARKPPGWKVLVRGPAMTIFRNRNALPRAFAPARIRRVTSKTPKLRLMKTVRDFSRIAWIEVDEEPFREIANGAAEVTTHADGPDLRIDVRAQAPAWIVVSETFWKGWHAFDERGREVPLHFANHAFIGFEVPAGEHRIRLVYRPRSFFAGLTLSGLAILGMVVVVWSRRRTRLKAAARRPVSSPGPGDAAPEPGPSPGPGVR